MNTCLLTCVPKASTTSHLRFWPHQPGPSLLRRKPLQHICPQSKCLDNGKPGLAALKCLYSRPVLLFRLFLAAIYLADSQIVGDFALSQYGGHKCQKSILTFLIPELTAWHGDP